MKKSAEGIIVKLSKSMEKIAQIFLEIKCSKKGWDDVCNLAWDEAKKKKKEIERDKK